MPNAENASRSPVVRTLRLLLLVVLVLCALLLAGAAPPAKPQAAKPEVPKSPDWLSINLVYQSDIDGKIGPCG